MKSRGYEQADLLDCDIVVGASAMRAESMQGDAVGPIAAAFTRPDPATALGRRHGAAVNNPFLKEKPS